MLLVTLGQCYVFVEGGQKPRDPLLCSCRLLFTVSNNRATLFTDLHSSSCIFMIEVLSKWGMFSNYFPLSSRIPTAILLLYLTIPPHETFWILSMASKVVLERTPYLMAKQVIDLFHFWAFHRSPFRNSWCVVCIWIMNNLPLWLFLLSQ